MSSGKTFQYMPEGGSRSDRHTGEGDSGQRARNVNLALIDSLAGLTLYSSSSAYNRGDIGERRRNSRARQAASVEEKNRRRGKDICPRVTQKDICVEEVLRTAERALSHFGSDPKLNNHAMGRESDEEIGVNDCNALVRDRKYEYIEAVNTKFWKLAEAESLANQLNTKMKKLPEKTIVMSADSVLPRKGENGLYIDPFEEEQKENEVELEEVRTSEFDFTEKEMVIPSIQAPVEVTYGDRKLGEDLKNKYMDILKALNEGLEEQAEKRVCKEKKQTVNEKPAVQEASVLCREGTPKDPQDYPNALRIFAVEYFVEKRGKYSFNFHTCTVGNAWEVHLESDLLTLHWYEIIRGNFPCHLYYDLEYPKSDGLNQDINGDSLVDTLIELTRGRIQKNFGLSFSDEDIFELDSTTDSKFSRHLIIKIPHHAFIDNSAVADLVSQVLADSGDSLLVENKDGVRSYFVDTAVYTKNRLFRMVYSCKGGKQACLMPTDRFVMRKKPKPSPAYLFSNTLVTSVNENDALLCVRGNGSDTGKANPSLGHPHEVSRRGFKRDSFTTYLPSREAMARLETLANSKDALKLVEDYAASRSKQSVHVRGVQICGGNGSVAYSLFGPGAHYCGNINRDHKNNFVYIVVNFRRLKMAQKCYDPDCAQYRSAWVDIPTKFRWQHSEDLEHNTCTKPNTSLIK